MAEYTRLEDLVVCQKSCRLHIEIRERAQMAYRDALTTGGRMARIMALTLQDFLNPVP